MKNAAINQAPASNHPTVSRSPRRATRRTGSEDAGAGQGSDSTLPGELAEIGTGATGADSTVPDLATGAVEGDWVSGSSPTGRSYQGLVEGFTSGGMVKIRTADGKRTLLDPATVEVIPAPGTSETVSEVLPILEAIATTEGGALAEAGDPGFLSLAQRINTLDGQGREAEETALNATRAALDLRRELGQWLAEAKTQIEAQEYGQWGKWLGANCPQLHPRMVSTYMRIHREWDYIQAHAGDEPPTLRGAIAILQAKNTLSAAPAPEPEPELTFEELVAKFAPWGEFARTKDPKFKYSFGILGKNYSFRSLKEADQFHQEHCHDWNTLAARQQQQQQLHQGRSCADCRHYEAIPGTQEFECGAHAVTYGLENMPAPSCLQYNPPLMTVPQSAETVSEVPGVEVAIAPAPQPHPAGVLASSARNKGEDSAEKDERYTPDYVWKACLKVVGVKQFDLDPATNDSLRPIVPCSRAYTKLDDGLSQDWSAESLWLNPPYSRMEEFTSKYLATWENSRFEHGFLLAKGDFSTKWAQRLLQTCTCVCLIDHRLTFLAPGRELETSFFASLLFYHGPALDEAIAELGTLGTVMAMAGGAE